MAYSDDNNFTTMQEEAIRRVREMQRRSRSIVGVSPDSEPASPKAEETPRTQNVHSPQKAPQSSSLLSGLLGGNLGDIKIDEEKAHVPGALWSFALTALFSLSAVIRREHIRKLLYLFHAFLVIKHILYFVHQIVQLFHRLFKLLPCKILFSLKLFEYRPCLW